MPVITVNEINGRVEAQKSKFISECEESYQLSIKKAAAAVCENKGRTLVMVAGPSSSGKTTSAKLLKAEFEKNSRRAIIISLDDFYNENNFEYKFEDGTVDYETVKALDVDYIYECLHLLMTEGRCRLPHFSFMTKRREHYVDTVIEKDDIIIVEGLHALNPVITEPLENEQMFKIYVSVSSRIFEGEKVLMSKRDIRFIRRLVRDFHFRDSDPANTFYLWNGVRMGEDRYLFPFSGRADMRIDSIHPYEPCIFKDIAMRLLDRIDEESVYYKKAQELKGKLSLFVALSESEVPENSLLKEFIG